MSNLAVKIVINGNIKSSKIGVNMHFNPDRTIIKICVISKLELLGAVSQLKNVLKSTSLNFSNVEFRGDPIPDVTKQTIKNILEEFNSSSTASSSAASSSAASSRSAETGYSGTNIGVSGSVNKKINKNPNQSESCSSKDLDKLPAKSNQYHRDVSELDLVKFKSEVDNSAPLPSSIHIMAVGYEGLGKLQNILVKILTCNDYETIVDNFRLSLYDVHDDSDKASYIDGAFSEAAQATNQEKVLLYNMIKYDIDNKKSEISKIVEVDVEKLSRNLAINKTVPNMSSPKYKIHNHVKTVLNRNVIESYAINVFSLTSALMLSNKMSNIGH